MHQTRVQVRNGAVADTPQSAIYEIALAGDEPRGWQSLAHSGALDVWPVCFDTFPARPGLAYVMLRSSAELITKPWQRTET